MVPKGGVTTRAPSLPRSAAIIFCPAICARSCAMAVNWSVELRRGIAWPVVSIVVDVEVGMEVWLVVVVIGGVGVGAREGCGGRRERREGLLFRFRSFVVLVVVVVGDRW